MSLLHALGHRLRVLFTPRSYDQELDEEIRFHLSLDAMQHPDTPDAPRRNFGNVTVHKEETRRAAGLGFVEMARQDLRFALRTFRRNPGFTAVAILTLALGIGANTAIFSAVNALLLRPLPYKDPARLMKVTLTVPAHGGKPARHGMVWSYPKFTVFRDAQTVFQDLTLSTDYQATLTGTGADAERATGEVTDARYFPLLGVHPALGRNFTASEAGQPGGPRAVILSHALWSRRFNANPAVLGTALDIDGDPYTIVGVAPAGFAGLSGHADYWLPILSQSRDLYTEAWNHSFTLIARLRAGVSPAQATAQVRQLGARVDAAYPEPDAALHWGAEAQQLDATRLAPVIRKSLLVLLGAVGLVLLIACANVANLFLVRAGGRRREIAVRLAVGAGRARLVRQLLTESILLAFAGGVASIALAWWGTHALAALGPSSLSRMQRFSGLGAVTFASIRFDVTTLVFAGLLALATGVVFGLVPALQSTHPSLTDALKEGDAVPRERGRHAFSARNLLAVAEIALAIVLLAGSGLMLRSLGKLLRVQPGFDASHLLSMRLNAPNGFGRDSLPQFYQQILDRIAALPGVTGVALGDCPPLNGGCNGTDLLRRDRPAPAPDAMPLVGVHWMTPSWPTVMRVPLERGRLFTSADRSGTRKSVLVSETAARTIWPGEDPIGRPVSVGQGGFWDDTAYVVGVVGDVRFFTLDSLPRADVYLPYAQSPSGRMMLFVRTPGSPVALAGAVRRALHELAPELPVYDVATMESRVADATAYTRFSTALLALFAAVALALATIGVYGVISYVVAQRTREIGIRVALGATRRNVVGLVVGQGVAIAAAGAVLGIAGALVATKVLRSLLYDVAPSDPWTFAGVVALLAAAVILASWLPAHRAASIQPTEALK